MEYGNMVGFRWKYRMLKGNVGIMLGSFLKCWWVNRIFKDKLELARWSRLKVMWKRKNILIRNNIYDYNVIELIVYVNINGFSKNFMI